MKPRKTIKRKTPKEPHAVVLREVTAATGIGSVISVRAAKTHLSALLDLVASGQKVTITSGGKPKAVLSPAGKHDERGVFTGTWKHLKEMPPWRGGPTAEEIIREDRDGRG